MILVSGASGLVGWHVVSLLLSQKKRVRALYHSENSKGIAVKNLQRLRRGDELELLEWQQSDIQKIRELEDSFEGVGEIYHCAGFVSFDERNAKKMRKINIEGTSNMVNLALDHKIQKFCHVSSIATLGDEIDGSPITEKSPRNNEKNRSSYALSKYGAEMEVWRASEEGLPVVIVNPGVILGAGNWNSGSCKIFPQIDKGFNFHLPKTSGFVGAEDVACAMLQLMEENCFQKRYILVSENHSIQSILTQTARAFGKNPPKIGLKPWMITLGWLFQSIGNLLWNGRKELTRESISELFTKNTFSSDRIKEEIGFEFQDIDEVIHKTTQVYLKQKKK